MEIINSMNKDDNRQAALGSEFTIITNKDYDEQHPLDLEANFEELTNYLPADFEFGSRPAAADEKKIIDDLYDEYIAMHSGELGFLDAEDLFPRSYHWKLDDRYAEGKKEILEEAIKRHLKIEETSSYQDYVEKKKRNKRVEMSWDD